MERPVENDRVYTLTQELLYHGHLLIEKKQKTLRHANGFVIGLVLVHERSIDDKSYKVTETITFYCENGLLDYCDRCRHIKIETEMDEEEVKQFEEDWISMWDPDFTVKEIDYRPHLPEVGWESDQ